MYISLKKSFPIQCCKILVIQYFLVKALGFFFFFLFAFHTWECTWSCFLYMAVSSPPYLQIPYPPSTSTGSASSRSEFSVGWKCGCGTLAYGGLTAPFYTTDLNSLGFWCLYLGWFLEPAPTTCKLGIQFSPQVDQQFSQRHCFSPQLYWGIIDM